MLSQLPPTQAHHRPHCLYKVVSRDNSHISQHVRYLLDNYLTNHPSATIDICSCEWTWLGPQLRVEMRRIADTHLPPEIPKTEMDPKPAIWANIQQDYTLSNYLSHITCIPPDSNKLAQAIVISKKKPACTCTYYALLALIRHL